MRWIYYKKQLKAEDVGLGEKIVVTCEIEVTLKMIGGKYKPLILHFLIEDGVKRYGELRALLGIPKKTLTAQLRDLETDGLVARTVFPELPLRVDYAITELGRTLQPILDLMCDWGSKNAGDRFEFTNGQCTEED